MKNNKSFEINLNLNVRGIAQSATLAVNELSAKLKKEGKHVYRLGLGQSPFPVPKVVVDELKVNAHQKDYLPVKGLPELRDAVAYYHSRRHGIERTADDVLIGPGSKELMFILQLVYYGDLIIPTPSWVSYAPQAHIIGRHVHWVPTKLENDWKLTAHELKKICKDDPSKPRIVILNYPSNPSGISYVVDELKDLAKVAREHRMILLSDEIYGELNFAGRHVSIARFYPEGTIISGGLSKWCGAGGWRLGTFVFPPSLKWLLDAMSVVASETYTSTSAPIQYAAVRAFKGGIELERYLWNSRKILKALGNRIYQKLDKAGVNVPKPDGAFYMFPDFTKFANRLHKRGIFTSAQFCQKLLHDSGVALLPGVAFGRNENEFTARLAFVDFDGSRALAAVEQLDRDHQLNSDFTDAYCNGTIKAIDVLCDWLQSL